LFSKHVKYLHVILKHMLRNTTCITGNYYAYTNAAHLHAEEEKVSNMDSRDRADDLGAAVDGEAVDIHNTPSAEVGAGASDGIRVFVLFFRDHTPAHSFVSTKSVDESTTGRVGGG
jgi:hypothetical protein